MNLQDWIIRHLKQKDLFKKAILEIVPDPEKKCDLVVKKANGSQQIFIVPSLLLPNISNLPVIIVTENKIENVDVLIKDWQSFVAHQNLWIYFVDSEKDKYWVINPFTHERITEKASLALGLKTMFETANV